MKKINGKPQIGLMLIKPMYPELERLSKLVDFFQVPGEDYFGLQSIVDLEALTRLSKIKPLHIHSIDLSIGSADCPNQLVLETINSIAHTIPIVSFSDHIGFSKVAGYWTGMPILNPPLTKESANKMAENILTIRKNIAGRPFYIENNSHCIDWPNSTFSEAEYTNYVAKKSGALILLDIPNMLADARNYSFDPYKFIDNLLTEKVEMIHLAGGDWLDGYSKGKITRGHNKPIEEDTWRLFSYTLKKCNLKYVVLERSRDINYTEIANDISRLREIVS